MAASSFRMQQARLASKTEQGTQPAVATLKAPCGLGGEGERPGTGQHLLRRLANSAFRAQVQNLMYDRMRMHNPQKWDSDTCCGAFATHHTTHRVDETRYQHRAKALAQVVCHGLWDIVYVSDSGCGRMKPNG